MTIALRIDIGRLLSRARFETPTGIDRVERAYVRHFLNSDRPVQFIARLPILGDRLLNHKAVSRICNQLDRQWQSGVRMLGWRDLVALFAGSKRPSVGERAITIIPSHQHLHRADVLAARRRAGKLILFIHDCIPSDYPEYARQGGAAKHRMRMSNALAHADGIIVNSRNTAERLSSYAAPGQSLPPIAVAHLGLDALPDVAPLTAESEPYFIIVGTIEPRKNHLLLLHIWRQWARDRRQDIPRLIIAGRRGWENENIIDLLDRCDALRSVAAEKGGLGDAELSALVRGSRALLMPSFVEGYGMPVAEALSAGVPVIASDLSVFREIAGDIPDYLDPLDGTGWAQTIVDYASGVSVLRQRQLERMRGWMPVEWDTHFVKVEAFIDGFER
jgi:glycosyltransferase involved in cell wall biosynthesis